MPPEDRIDALESRVQALEVTIRTSAEFARNLGFALDTKAIKTRNTDEDFLDRFEELIARWEKL